MKVKLYLGEAVGIILKTLPFLWVRIGSYALLGLGLLLYFAVLGGIAWLFGQIWGPLGFIIFLAAFGGAFGIVRWVVRYYFYLLDAAHVSVMTEFIVHGKAPDGSQVAYGKEQVKSRFRDTSIMFAVDRIVSGVVRAFNRSFANVMQILPIPGMDSLTKFIGRVTKFASKYIDEAILSRAYKEREENVWAVAKDGVILYAQCWKPILANAVALTLLSYVEFFAFLLILGIPALILSAILPAWMDMGLGIFVLVGAWMMKLAVADAYAMAATLLAYHRSTEGMVPDPTWQNRLENVSDQFRELTQKAREYTAPAGGGARESSATAEPEYSSTDGALTSEDPLVGPDNPGLRPSDADLG